MTSDSHQARSALRGDIEGLRSLAVLFVLIYHLGVDRLSGGFVGVDVFFVISGFLITSGLLSEVERAGSVSIARFYARRARRLLPAATAVLVATALVGWQVLPRGHWDPMSRDVLAAALYVVNWALALRSVDYLAEDVAVSPVQHYWSLSVEEQFYVVIPIMMILVAALSRRFGWRARTAITVAIGVIVAVSLGYSVVHTAASPQAAYFYSTTRAWELGIGSLVACAVPFLRRWSWLASTTAAAVGVAAVVASGVLVSTSTPWPGSAAMLPTTGTALVIAAGVSHSRTVMGRLLGVRPLVWIGGLSYSIYLWHWPLIVLSGHVAEPTRWHKVAIAVGSVALAWASKKLIEDPIRFGPMFARRTRPTLVMGAAGTALSVLAAGFVLVQAPRLGDRPMEAQGVGAILDGDDTGTPQASDRPTPSAVDTRTPKVSAAQPDASADLTRSGLVFPDPAVATKDIPAYYGDECQIAEGVSEIDFSCVYGAEEGRVTVAMLGDSKMGQWFEAINTIAERRGWRLELYLKSACAFSAGAEEPDCRAFNENVVDHLTSSEARVDLVITSSGADNGERDFTAAALELVEGYDKYWSRLEAMGTQVVVMSDSPRPPPGEPVYECIEKNPEDYLACAFPANRGRGTASLRKAVERNPGRIWVDLNPWICPETPQRTCPAVVGHTLVYRQGSHITKSYVETMIPLIERVFDEKGVGTH